MMPPGYLPVHCCCEPGKRLGYLPVPRSGGDRLLIVLPRGRMPASMGEALGMPVVDTACLRVRRLHKGAVQMDAFDSGHQPLEVLRRIPGWRDA